LYFVGEEERRVLSEWLYRAYWVQGRDVSETSVLIDVVRRSGIKDAEGVVKAIEDGRIEGEKQRKELEVATDDAVRRGAFGVPGFWVGDEVWVDQTGNERRGRLYWGQDRMQFVEAVLMALKKGGGTRRWSKIKKPLQSLIPRCIPTGAQRIAEGEEVKMEFWYDFSSPWAFLGWTQLARLQRLFGSRLKIEMKPFLLGILFRE
jgi:2-hydroxychromene-2-carboxylate isomerase